MDVMFSWSRYTSDILSCFNQLEISVLLSVPWKCTAFWAQLCETNGAVSGLLLCIQVIYKFQRAFKILIQISDVFFMLKNFQVCHLHTSFICKWIYSEWVSVHVITSARHRSWNQCDVVLTSSANWSARCCMSDSSLRMSASSAMAARCGGWRGSPAGKRRSAWELGESWKRE